MAYYADEQVLADTSSAVRESIMFFDSFPEGDYRGNDFGNLGAIVDLVKKRGNQLVIVYNPVVVELKTGVIEVTPEDQLIISGTFVNPRNLGEVIVTKKKHDFNSRELDKGLLIAHDLMYHIAIHIREYSK